MNFTKLFVALFASLFLISIASAAVIDITGVSQSATTVAHTAGSFTVTFTANYTGASASTNVAFSLVSSQGTATLTRANVTLAQGVPQTLTATLAFPSFQSGSIAGNIVADPDAAGSSENIAYSATITSASTYTLTKSADITASQNGSLTLANTGNQALTFSLVKASGALNVSFSNANPTVSAGSSTTVTVMPAAGQSFGIGTSSATITSVPTTSGVANQSLTFSRTGGFCPAGKVSNNLSITDIEISNSGDDDDKWRPLDKITVDIDVENTASDDLEDIIVEFGLFDSNGKNVVSDLDFINEDEEEFSIGDLDEGDDATATFEFRIPGDLDEGDYSVIVKIYSDDVSESSMCTDSVADGRVESISVESEDDEGKFIAFDNIVISPEQATCGDTVSLTLDAINIGENDEDKVKINLINRLLGVNEYVEFTQGLDQGDSKMVSFNFVIPQITDGTYKIEVDAEYDYKNGLYRESLDETVEIPVKVFGCSGSSDTGFVSISADLASDAVTGEELKVTTTLRNNGDKTALFAVTATGFESWASLKDISENIVQIPAGQSKDITITLMPQDDAAGEQSFTINARTEDGKIQSRQVVVQVASDSLFDGSSWTWVLIAVNVVLVILIIVVAVIVSRR